MSSKYYEVTEGGKMRKVKQPKKKVTKRVKKSKPNKSIEDIKNTRDINEYDLHDKRFENRGFKNVNKDMNDNDKRFFFTVTFAFSSI